MNENLNEQLQNNDGEKRQVIVHKEERFAGPVPHPEIIEKGLPLFGGGLSLAGLAMIVAAFITSRERKGKVS